MGLILVGSNRVFLCALASSLAADCESMEKPSPCDRMDMPTHPTETWEGADSGLMFSLELCLQIRPELVNQVVNHTNWDPCRYPPERRAAPAISCGIIRIRKTAGGDTAQQARPVKPAPSRVFPSHHRSNHCVLQT